MKRSSSVRAGMRWLRIVCTVALLIWLGLRLDWHSLQHWPAHAALWLTGALLAVEAGNLIAGWRWALLMRAGGFNIRTRDALRWYIAAGLLNQGLPSVVGGDAFRTWAAIEACTEPRHARLRNASLITVFDRLVGLAGSLILAGAGMVVTGATLAPWAPRLGAFALAALGLGWLVTALLAGRFTPGPGWQAALRASLKPPVVAMSAAVHGGNVIAMALCLRATGLHVSPAHLIPPLLMLLPALGILLMLPVSVAGWGVRETALSAALLLWGVPTTTTVAASIAFGLATVVSLLPGAVTLATTRLSRNEAVESEPGMAPDSQPVLQTRQ